MYFIGVDVGGTNLKIGLIENNRIIDKESFPTNTFDIVKQITNAIKDMCSKNNLDMTSISGVGVGFPGLVINGKVVESANIGLSDCQLNELIADEVGVPCVVRNDGEMATLAEHRLGSGQGTNNMLLLTIGTGIGGGIIINNQLYVGNGGAGELGHITLVNDGIPCGCGRRGCAEKYLSAIAVQQKTKEYFRDYPNSVLWNNSMNDIKLSDIFAASERGDECAKVIMAEYIENFADYLLGFCNIFRPEKILIGGGISHTPEIINRVAMKCKEKNFGFKGSPVVDITLASLGNDAGILGTCVCFENALGVDLSNVGVQAEGQEVNVQAEQVFDLTKPVDAQQLESSDNLMNNNNVIDNPVEQTQLDERVVNTIASDYGFEGIEEDLPVSESDSLLSELYAFGNTQENQSENSETNNINTIENDMSTVVAIDEQQSYVDTNEQQSNMMSYEQQSEVAVDDVDPYDDEAEGMGNPVMPSNDQTQPMMSTEELMQFMMGKTNSEE